jgi:hypothetical protein
VSEPFSEIAARATVTARRIIVIISHITNLESDESHNLELWCLRPILIGFTCDVIALRSIKG